jgi:RepB DNA-primase from phage plasmid
MQERAASPGDGASWFPKTSSLHSFFASFSAHSRTKGDIKDIRHVYLDLDRKGDQALEAVRNSTDVPPPNFVLDTSPGKHQVVWKVSGFSQDEGESLLHNLANKFGGDLAATDSTRVLRLPGFPSHKLPEEFIVQARQESKATYTLRDFTIDDDFPEPPRPFGEAQERRRTVPSDHKSQSEHDWVYATRALARGDDPEVVIQRIADYRGNEKHSAYARRTLGKVKARRPAALDSG